MFYFNEKSILEGKEELSRWNFIKKNNLFFDFDFLKEKENISSHQLGRRSVERILKKINSHLPQNKKKQIEVKKDQKTGMPLFPEGYFGSITHTKNLAFTVIGKKKLKISMNQFINVGIDLEGYRGKILSLKNKILRDQEKVFLRQLLNKKKSQYSWTEIELLTLFFSAKESIFKCYFPKIKIHFGFHRAQIIEINFEKNTFTYTLDFLENSKGERGEFLKCQDFLFTGVFHHVNEIN